MDNMFIERLWRSMKYECVYLHELNGGRDTRHKIDQWIEQDNAERPHSILDGKTPNMIYFYKV